MEAEQDSLVLGKTVKYNGSDFANPLTMWRHIYMYRIICGIWIKSGKQNSAYKHFGEVP